MRCYAFTVIDACLREFVVNIWLCVIVPLRARMVVKGAWRAPGASVDNFGVSCGLMPVGGR